MSISSYDKVVVLYAARMTSPLQRRLAQAEALRAIHEAHQQVEQAQRRLDEAVKQARAHGASWGDIAEIIGVTRQTAWHRWGRGDDSEES